MKNIDKSIVDISGPGLSMIKRMFSIICRKIPYRKRGIEVLPPSEQGG